MYRQEVIDDMPLLSPVIQLDYPPTAKELSEALSNLKNRKAGGKSGILPELVHCGGHELEDRILRIMEQILEGLVDDWKDAVIMLIPKKGDL